MKGVALVLGLSGFLAFCDPVLALGTEIRVKRLASPAPAPSVLWAEEAQMAWLPGLFQAVPSDLREHLQLIAIDPVPGGVVVRAEVEASGQETLRVHEALEAQVEKEIQASGLAASVGIDRPAPPALAAGPRSEAPASVRAIPVAGTGALLLLLVLFRRKKRNPIALPDHQGIPVLGILPASLGQGGRFMEWLSPPCQALSHFFQRLSRTGGQLTREIAVTGPTPQTSTAAVTAALAISLLRDGGRVLVVDLGGEESPLPAMLEETDDGGEAPPPGTFRPTHLGDLVLLTGLSPVQDQRPTLPEDLLHRYRWVVYHLPEDLRMRQMRHLVVIRTPPKWGPWMQERMASLMAGKRVLGYVYHGGRVQARVKTLYMTRFYSERLTGQETAAASAAG
ncbi:MAG: hypothetical protein VKP72_06250 [bacterium]|nr:hypothetical protein [bacterium]